VRHMSKSAANLVQALLAVVLGNAGYFVAMRFLPVRARHVPFRLDLGLLVDSWFCLVVFGAIKMVGGKGKTAR